MRWNFSVLSRTCFGKLQANSADLFETPDSVFCKNEDVLPDLKLVSKAKSNISFLILTSDEAYRDKLEAKKRKEEKEERKRARPSNKFTIFFFNYENCFFILIKYFCFLCSSCVEFSLELPSHFLVCPHI